MADRDELQRERNSRRKLLFGVLTAIAILAMAYIAFVVFFATDDPDRLPSPADTVTDVLDDDETQTPASDAPEPVDPAPGVPVENEQ